MRHTILEVGQIVNTHGLSGEVKVIPWTDHADDFEGFAHVYLQEKSEANKRYINSIKYQKNNLIVHFKGIDDIDSAEKLKGCRLLIERDQLGEPETGYYICDLIGIKVVTDEHAELGEIADVFATGSNDVYVVRTPSGKEILLPVIPEVVRTVDIDAEIAVVHLIEGLID